jgi:hypothetical protein
MKTKKKKVILDEACYAYRCRLCHKEYCQLVGGWDSGDIIDTMLRSLEGSQSHHIPSLISMHYCGKGTDSYGISDFIGTKRRITKL